MEKDKLIRLVQQAQQGDSDALGQLYEAYYQNIYYFIHMNVKDSELAADLTQDTFAEILETIGNLNDPAAFVSWSHRIAWHRCTAHFRKRQDVLLSNEEEELDPFENEPETNEEFIPDAALDKKELRQTLLKMVQDLPEQQRSAIMLFYYTELSIKDIAQIQETSENTVKSRLNYGRKALKDAVETYERKSGVKLRCAGIVPLLLWLFGEAFAAEAAAATGAAAVGASAAAAGSSSAASTAAGTAAKVAGKALSKKIIAGIAAAAVAGGVVTAALLPGDDKPMSWYGHTNLSVANLFDVHSSWFDLELETLTDTEISGDLVITKENQPLYDICFDGIGTEIDDKDPGTTNQIQYELTFDEPAILEFFGEWEYTSATMIYDKEQDTFCFDSLMGLYEDITLVRTGSEAVQVFDKNVVWVGDGKDHYPTYSQNCQIRLQVEEMTNIGIRGRLTASTEEGIFHETAFTGRGFFHNGNYYYHLSFETPRQEESFMDYNSFLMLLYNPGADTLGTLDSFNSEIYRVTFARES